jgi:hypothetical protein
MIIAMWSGPRNLSTAMMRSFGARADCSVIDEPFFAPFLAVSGKDHPGREATLAHHNIDPQRVAELCAAPPVTTRYCFQKHMPHHMLPGFALDWAKEAKHFFLIRAPERVLASYIKGRDVFDLEDLGFAPQRRLFETLTEMTGRRPPVIDSVEILKDPEGALRGVCRAIDIPFDRAMLKWEAGRRPEDGAWAPYWYHGVENSTGFGPPPTDVPKIPAQYNEILAQCRDDYAALSHYCVSY